MFNMLKLSGGSSYYDGSRAFEWLANFCGLSVDLINFLICQILALFLAYIFRSILHPSKVSAVVRHTFGLTIGLFLGYFCFGLQAIHIATLPTVCYFVIRTQSPEIVQKAVMIVALFYLLSIHLHRQMYDYGSYSLDITGPLMIITQKVTSLAFSIHDGFTKKDEKTLSESQQYYAVNRVPSPLEYFSYVLHFQGLMAGPMVFYRDYIDFIEGYNLLKTHGSNTDLSNNNAKEIIIEPSPIKAVVKKIIGSIICAFIFMKFVTVYPIKKLNDDHFVNDTTIFYKFWYIMMATTIVRFKYYHAWLWADAICNNAGLGFTGYDEYDNPKWDLLSNINVFAFEFATNMRDAISSWNIGTNKWLRFIVYERVTKKYGTMLTFGLSALWHGFYPGYYLTFATGTLFLEAARYARKMFRHRFQQTQFTRITYDIITYLTTRICMGYITFPFVLLGFWGSIIMYLKLYMCLHLVAFTAVFILPNFIKKEQKKIDDKAGGDYNLVKTVSSTGCVFNGNNNKMRKNVVALDTNNIELKNKNMNDLIGDIDNNLNKKKSNLKKSVIITSKNPICIKHDDNEIDNLSNKLKEKIEIETRNIEEFIDKTVNGIVELKDDLMRSMNKNELKLFDNEKSISSSGSSSSLIPTDDTINKTNQNCNSNFNNTINENDVNFLKKEIDAINAAVQQANVLPAVLSNGHAK